ncbi:hypothetical protein LTR50_005194 [Elasticomyces elasticus]|nr:hypothetical protein LTR50_005194 [Elasticomyces elasticus]
MEEVKTADVEVKASPTSSTVEAMTKDEHYLATLGYRQVFIRSFNMFENWAATFTTMGMISEAEVRAARVKGGGES